MTHTPPLKNHPLETIIITAKKIELNLGEDFLIQNNRKRFFSNEHTEFDNNFFKLSITYCSKENCDHFPETTQDYPYLLEAEINKNLAQNRIKVIKILKRPE